MTAEMRYGVQRQRILDIVKEMFPGADVLLILALCPRQFRSR